MSSWPDSLIGGLVVRGYMASYHEHTVYLHDSQGKRWAEIDPHRIALHATVYRSTSTGDTNVKLEAADLSALVEALEEHA